MRATVSRSPSGWRGWIAGDGPRAGAACRVGRDLPARGQRAARRQHAAQPRPRAHAEALGEGGRAGFYDGEIARELARFSKANGGFFDARDLKAQSARWGEPLMGTYRDVTIYETPAPTQGFSVLEMLNLLEPFELHGSRTSAPTPRTCWCRPSRSPITTATGYLADPLFGSVPIDRLISKAYADERARLDRPGPRAAVGPLPSHGSLSGDTVFIAAVDAQGNAASLIHSLYGVFGSGVVAGRTGVVLQNRSAYFSLDPAHPNCVEPGKTPLHTLIASLAFRDDSSGAWWAAWVRTASRRSTLQAYAAMIDFGRDIQEAVEAPRWLSGRFGLLDARDTLHIEARFPAETIAELERRGHPVNRWGDWNELAGHAHGITIDPDSGMRLGGSDPRSDGAAIGY